MSQRVEKNPGVLGLIFFSDEAPPYTRLILIHLTAFCGGTSRKGTATTIPKLRQIWSTSWNRRPEHGQSLRGDMFNQFLNRGGHQCFLFPQYVVIKFL